MSIQYIRLIRELRATLAKMELALDAVEDAIAWTDAGGGVEWCNKGMIRLLERQSVEILRENLADLLPLELDGGPLERRRHPVLRALGGETAQLSARRPGPGGLALRVFAAPFKSYEGSRGCVVVVHRDEPPPR